MSDIIEVHLSLSSLLTFSLAKVDDSILASSIFFSISFICFFCLSFIIISIFFLVSSLSLSTKIFVFFTCDEVIVSLSSSLPLSSASTTSLSSVVLILSSILFSTASFSLVNAAFDFVISSSCFDIILSLSLFVLSFSSSSIDSADFIADPTAVDTVDFNFHLPTDLDSRPPSLLCTSLDKACLLASFLHCSTRASDSMSAILFFSSSSRNLALVAPSLHIVNAAWTPAVIGSNQRHVLFASPIRRIDDAECASRQQARARACATSLPSRSFLLSSSTASVTASVTASSTATSTATFTADSCSSPRALSRRQRSDDNARSFSSSVLFA